MGIKLLDKSNRSPVSCKEISREQVANRLQSRCKQGLNQMKTLTQLKLEQQYPKSNSHAPNLHVCIINIRVPRILLVCIFAHANANTHGS